MLFPITYDRLRRINDDAHLRKAVMTNQEQPVHLNNHHTDTLTAIFAHPTSHNVRWHDAISLLEAVGTVEENHSGKFKIHVGDQMEFFDRPKGHDCGEQQSNTGHCRDALEPSVDGSINNTCRKC